jgi:hypothetical protein
MSGKFFVDRRPARPDAAAYDATLRRRLWEMSEELPDARWEAVRIKSAADRTG